MKTPVAFLLKITLSFQSFRESFCDYVVGQTASDYYEDVTQFVFKELDEAAIKDVVLGIFLSRMSNDMTLQQVNYYVFCMV